MSTKRGTWVRVDTVVRWLAICDHDDCTWSQEHRTPGSAYLDAERHEREWHPAVVEPDEPPKVVDLMAALEASLAAAKANRAAPSPGGTPEGEQG